MIISPLHGCASLCAVFFFSHFRVVHGVGNLTAAQHRENGISCATTAVLAIVVFHLFCCCFFGSCLFTKQENEVVSQDVMNMLGQKTAESWGNFYASASFSNDPLIGTWARIKEITRRPAIESKSLTSPSKLLIERLQGWRSSWLLTHKSAHQRLCNVKQITFQPKWKLATSFYWLRL